MDILTVVGVTATTASVTLGDAEEFAIGYTISLYDSTKTTVVQTAVTIDEEGLGNYAVATFTGLTPNTEYYAYYSAAGYKRVRTLTDEPKVATESQWEDLANRVKNASVNVVQTTGSSTTDVMSQNAVTNAIQAIGAGTRRATSTGWNTSTPLDYIKGSASYSHEGQTRLIAGELFPTAKNLSDFPVYAGIGIYAPEAGAEYTPYLLTQQVSDDGTGTTSGTAGAHRIALYSEVPRITMQTTDPGEGATLAANSFIAVYSA